MTGKLFWKFSFIIALLLWCYASISPIQDRPFSSYTESQATDNLEEFDALLEAGNAWEARMRITTSSSSMLRMMRILTPEANMCMGFVMKSKKSNLICPS